jgi:AcrR family transcriptional regulator
MATNPERSATTQASLIAVAAALFGQQGYAATSTEAILAKAQLRRGALYHHFADKSALFEAVCVQHAEAAMQAIITATADIEEPFEALVTGSIAWIDYMLEPAVRQILIVDAPTVLGWQRWQQLDDRYSTRLLRQGVQAALDAKAIATKGNAEFLTVLINGALNAVALRVGSQNDLDDWPVQLREWFEGMRIIKTVQTVQHFE